jgi:hypothetical protein
MKREDVKKLLGDSATDETIDGIMKLHGEDVNAQKTAVTNLQSQLDAANGQLTDANKTIEGFKALKPDELKAAADDWRTKFEQAQKDSTSQLAQIKFDHALESALTGAKAKNVKAVTALLSKDALKLQEDGLILGLKEQLEKIKTENDFLFEGDKPAPRIVTGANNTQAANISAFEAAVNKGGNFKTPQ